MVLRAAARGIALFLGMAFGAGLIYYVGGWLLPVPEPWSWVVAFILAASLFMAIVLILVRILRTSAPEFLVTIGALLLSLAGFVVFLANVESTHPVVNYLVPSTRVAEAPYPINPAFPVDYESLGGGRYRAEVTNATAEKTSVWCGVEASYDGTVVFKDFKVGPIPAGERITVEGTLAGSGDGPYSGGCRKKSY